MTCNLTLPVSCNADPLGPSMADACPGPNFFVFMTILNSFVRANNKISGICERVKPVEETDRKYDFIVVGGGAAGAAVAGRLSEICDWKILLLEAGPDEPAGAQVPGFSASFLINPTLWDYKTTNESYACLATNGSCPWRQGKNLGGNTAHNSMQYLRGHARDYDDWAALGNEGWRWDDVLPYFIKSEANAEIDRVGGKYHGTGGPLPVERFPYLPPYGNSILAAAEEVGYGVSEDLNGDQITGVSRIQSMQKAGVRYSSARSYLWPARNRTNLHVSLNSTVTRVILRNKRAVGVEYYKDGELKRVYATREVILSAGIVGSPRILLLSGIGPKDHLQLKGVKLVLDLPGVGENLHDHPCIIIPFTINEPSIYDNNWVVARQYLRDQTGPLSAIGASQVLAILASPFTTPDHPDVELYFDDRYPSCAPGPVGARAGEGKSIVNIEPSYLHPKSRGRISLASNDPLELPVIWNNYLAEQQDVDGMVAAIRLALAVVESEALRPYNFTLSETYSEACSAYEFGSDDYWVCYSRQNNYAMYHQAGTCKMGNSSDPMAVVDARLRVRRIEGLRVVDNSIMPQVPSCNTAAPAMMIGERGADFIKEDWGRKDDQTTCNDSVNKRTRSESRFAAANRRQVPYGRRAPAESRFAAANRRQVPYGRRAPAENHLP